MKHLKIEVTHELPDTGVFDHARAVLAGEKVVEAINAAVAEHMPGAVVSHHIVSPEPETLPAAKRGRKALGAGLPTVASPVEPAPEPVPDASQAEPETPVVRGRHRAAA